MISDPGATQSEPTLGLCGRSGRINRAAENVRRMSTAKAERSYAYAAFRANRPGPRARRLLE